MKDWQTEIGNIVRETYAREGYGDITILIGATKGEEIHTQCWYPGDTQTDFDFRFLFFAMMNHVFSEYNDAKNSLNPDDL